jgi:hypothetical protein
LLEWAEKNEDAAEERLRMLLVDSPRVIADDGAKLTGPGPEDLVAD